MTKTKSQLRAEAVERLRQLNCMDVDCYQLLEAVVDDAGEKVGYRVEIRKLIDLLVDDAHESRGSYEERLYDVPVSDCPYCGCKRVVIHDCSEIYENPHSYRVEHIDEKEAFEAGCFETYYSFDSVEKAVGHANMRDLLTDDGTCPNSDGTCPIDDWTPSIERSNDGVERSNDGVAKLDAQSRAEIEDMERSRAVSGDLRQDADVDSTEDAKVAQDTREKLEASSQTAAGYIYGRGFTNGLADAWNDDEVDTAANQIIQLLDRQASITEREAYQRGYDDGLHANTRAAFSMAKQAFGIRKPEKYNLAHESEAVNYKNDDSLQDSREKLEADICAKLNDMARFSWRVDGIMKQAKGWLDRQAAITQDETIHDYNIAARESGRILRDEIAELKANNQQLHTLASEQAAHIDELEAERDRYREKLGRAVDAAHEVVRMMEVE